MTKSVFFFFGNSSNDASPSTMIHPNILVISQGEFLEYMGDVSCFGSGELGEVNKKPRF